MLSGVLSLALLSADLIVLERISGNLVEVASYGVASLFTKAAAFIPSAIGRVYFVEIGAETGIATAARRQYFAVTLCVGAASAALLASLGPVLIGILYAERYASSVGLLRILSVGLVFSFLWHAVSTTNIASGWARRSVIVSGIGASVGLILMLALARPYGAVGIAWATNLAYASGSLYGLWVLLAPQNETSN
jgi:O-antigen/teichoic acid export membrane protein